MDLTSLSLDFRQQRTLSRPTLIEGVGYWSGISVRVELRPAATDTGVVFVRTDLPNARPIPANAEHRVDVPRRTNLQLEDASVEMVEHLLAALCGLRVDNCEVRIDSAELPGTDGSSQSFVAAIRQAGVQNQRAPRTLMVVTEPVRIEQEDAWIEARPARQGELSIHYQLDYGPGPIGSQSFELEINPESFEQELAAARTVVLESEAEQLRRAGLGRHVTHRDLLVYGEDGPIDNPLRFADECVRHKTLDVVGDLALAGCDIAARITASRSGHRLNSQLVKRLWSGATEHVERRKAA